MPYNSVIDRTDAGALIPEDVSREIIKNVPQMSAVMQLGRRLPNMSRKQRRLPVLSLLPTAYFVDGDTGLKQTTNVEWANKYLNAEELAVIVPIPESVMDDVDYDIWTEAQPLIEEAIGVAFDQAVLYGTNAPAAWPDDILTGSAAAAHTLAVGAVGPDLYGDILGVGGTFSKVEADGYMVNGSVAAMTMKSRLRDVRDANGNPIFNRDPGPQAKFRYTLDGEPVLFPTNGAVDPAQSLLVSGDWQQLVYALRSDISVKKFYEGVITDAAGLIVYNLMQQDMMAIRVTLRIAWQLPNPINRLQPTEASRYPFAVLTP